MHRIQRHPHLPPHRPLSRAPGPLLRHRPVHYCVMEVDGRPNVKTCITRVREGMTIRTQAGNGGSAS